MTGNRVVVLSAAALCTTLKVAVHGSDTRSGAAAFERHSVPDISEPASSARSR
jgi:hypothetical protein